MLTKKRWLPGALIRLAVVTAFMATGGALEVVHADECTQYEDCAPNVCVAGECVPCWNEHSQCDLGFEYCDANTGECTPGEDCLPEAFPFGTGLCGCCDISCGQSMFCPASYECDDGEPYDCVPIS